MNLQCKNSCFLLPVGVAMAHISYTMSTSALPDMYTLSPRASGVHIRQTTHVHGISTSFSISTHFVNIL